MLSDVPEVLMITGADRDPDPRFELSLFCLFTMFTHSRLNPRPELQALSCGLDSECPMELRVTNLVPSSIIHIKVRWVLAFWSETII